MFRRQKSARTKVMGSAGVLGTLFGAAGAGQIMIWLGFFKPGVTPNEQILQYWPGFLVGALVGGVACLVMGLLAYAFLNAE